MEFSIKVGTPEKIKTDCIVAGVLETRVLSTNAQTLDNACGGLIQHMISRGDQDGMIGQSQWFYRLPNVTTERVMLIGCGKANELDQKKFQQIVIKALDAVKLTGAKDVTFCLCDLMPAAYNLYWKVRRIVEIVDEGLYQFDQFKTKEKPNKLKLKSVSIQVANRSEQTIANDALRHALAISKGISTARTLGNLPSNVCTPTYLADHAKAMEKNYSKITTKVLTNKDMEKLGMGAFLSVAAGTDEPAKLIAMEYRGGGELAKPTVLVGKGITFDTGGISLKPGLGMDEMKFDMCGAASVIGSITAVAELGLPLNVVGLIACTENMPSGKATKPGDIVKTMSGQTVEILNTDAEGRLVLCDTLTYAEKYKPAAVVDVATLTGACVVALGKVASGLYSTNDALADKLLKAGEYTNDRAWRMPLWDDYQEQLDSNFADMANIGGPHAGSITAACFLARFTKKYPWAHLDIAGTAWRNGKDKGATGRPVPMLVQYLLNQVHTSRKA